MISTSGPRLQQRTETCQRRTSVATGRSVSFRSDNERDCGTDRCCRRITGIRIRLYPDEEPKLTTVFAGGSRRISRIGADVKQRIDLMIEGGLLVLVGDANGADKAIQTYLHEREYRNVRVFCTGSDCRNNVG